VSGERPSVARTEPDLDIALAEIRRTLDNQFSTLIALRERAGVTLGLVVATFTLLFTLGSKYVQSQPIVSVVVAILMMTSAGLLAASFLSIQVGDVPSTSWLFDRLNESGLSTTAFKEQLIEQYAFEHGRNEKATSRRPYVVDTGFLIFIIAVGLFATLVYWHP